MKSTTRRNGKSTKSTRSMGSAAGQARWLPTQATRPQTFADKRKVANKNACRGKVTW